MCVASGFCILSPAPGEGCAAGAPSGCGVATCVACRLVGRHLFSTTSSRAHWGTARAVRASAVVSPSSRFDQFRPGIGLLES